jgi:hypothetical protein
MADQPLVEVIERRYSSIPKWTILKNGWVYLITFDKKIADKYKKESKDGIR